MRFDVAVEHADLNPVVFSGPDAIVAHRITNGRVMDLCSAYWETLRSAAGFRLAAAALTFAGDGGVGEGGRAMKWTSLNLLVAVGISAACVGGRSRDAADAGTPVQQAPDSGTPVPSVTDAGAPV